MPNPCVSGTCLNQGGNFFCRCNPGYTGQKCEICDPCTPNPCSNNGQCTSQGTSFVCQCPPGFSGSRCEIRDPCTPNPCANNGQCMTQGSNFMCTCPQGNFFIQINLTAYTKLLI